MSAKALALSALLCVAPAWGATRNVTCSGGDIKSAMDSAIASSSNGDVVNISAGSCSMSKLNLMTNKNITIQGQGIGVTNITANAFGELETTGSGNPQWRLTGFTLTSTAAAEQYITVWANQSATWRGGFRIDHIKFNYPNATGTAIRIYGPVWGVIDHIEFIQNHGIAILTGLQISSEGGSVANASGSWAAGQVFRPGAQDYLYIEDSTFTGLTDLAAIDTGYTGGRFVIRRNTFNNAILFGHWTSGGNINSMWWEIYNNKFSWPGGDIYPMRMQGGGTGLIYNNTIVGYADNYILLGEGRLPDQGQSSAPLLFCDGTHNWDGNAGQSGAPGWPCLAQTGRNADKTMSQIQSGSKQSSFPLYLWNNGPQDKCRDSALAGSACDNTFHVDTYSPSAVNYFKSTPHSTGGYGNGDVDYSITASKPAGAGTHTLTYTPLVYPHPLTGAAPIVLPNAPTDIVLTRLMYWLLP